MIPLAHDFTDETVLVVGGGDVGARKARRFAREARVVVVSPAFDESLEADAETVRTAEAPTPPTGEGPGVELLVATPTPDTAAEWVEAVDPALVVAATDDDAVNEAVADAAREHGALVNRTDRAGGRDVGSVVVPATVEDGPVTVAITTGGASPALSKYLRERLEDELVGAGAMASLTGELRVELRDSDRSPAERRDAVRRVVRSPLVWKALRAGETNPRRVAERVMNDDTNPDGGSR